MFPLKPNFSHGLGWKPHASGRETPAPVSVIPSPLPSTEPRSCCFVLLSKTKRGPRTEPLLGDLACSCSHGKFLLETLLFVFFRNYGTRN